MKKVKELNENEPLKGKKVRTPKGVIGYYIGYRGGVALLESMRPEDIVEGKVYPQIVRNEKDIREWGVADEYPVNCHLRTKLKDIDNT